MARLVNNTMNIRRIIHNLDDDEEVHGIYHQFWLAFFWHWLGGFIILMSPFFFLYLFLQWGAIGSGLLIALFVIGAFWLFRTWRIWYFSIIAMTNKRVIIIDQSGIMDRAVSQVDFDKIYDVSYRHKGILQTISHVGSLFITPGSFEKIELKNMHAPAEIQHLIFKLQKEYGLEPPEDAQEMIRLSRVKKEEKARAVEQFFGEEE
ncbi:PH domain-containing protein [Patescibacteria group bacterium]|nr:PH domain-containing protein [Patescibacteria group bacterium]